MIPSGGGYPRDNHKDHPWEIIIMIMTKGVKRISIGLVTGMPLIITRRVDVKE